MTDIEIIKGLECCEYLRCHDCPLDEYEYCTDELIITAHYLTKSQQAEIERLNTNMDSMVTEHERLINNAKSEAIKEFAEKLKEKSCNHLVEYDEGGWSEKVSAVKVDKIDNLVKEMTGGENDGT